jgi:hypothetical protein
VVLAVVVMAQTSLIKVVRALPILVAAAVAVKAGTAVQAAQAS